MSKPEVRICNCSECGDQIETVWRDGERVSEGPTRVNGRPLCERCSWVPVPHTTRKATRDDDAGPWQEYAVRCLEDALND